MLSEADTRAKLLVSVRERLLEEPRAGGASGSMKKITRTQLLNELVPFPTGEAQDSFAKRLSARLESAKELVGVLAAESEALDRIPAALLRRAFSAEL